MRGNRLHPQRDSGEAVAGPKSGFTFGVWRGAIQVTILMDGDGSLHHKHYKQRNLLDFEAEPAGSDLCRWGLSKGRDPSQRLFSSHLNGNVSGWVPVYCP